MTNLCSCTTVLAVLLTAASCGEASSTPAPSSAIEAETGKADDSSRPQPKTQELAPGLLAVDIQEGSGKKAKKGSVVKVHATGRLTNGKVFWSSYTKGQPIDFPLIKGNVIDGWVMGVPGMREGGRRELTIPYRMAYGEKGRPGTIPPKSDLIFDIELIQVVK